ncbi:molybdate transport system ATP-binding protein [Muriicola jejuensis]|uniref:ATP-binding cassette domain-containing protein n=1 Tax=Muriicola jejuensis TaxID=504488 RepID=A0A6P0U980_9FLAO|nr:ABC transporter ATP-binding protein [Muriicola jejuensis]NER09132.1 ATP-binding cassette domain-containing protein [Muriicola jejuensis]SMP10828.1 molybdate transport system ATP-binding protein [Muriicola jejuensis]
MIEIRVRKILEARGGDFTLDVDLELQEGEFITLYGPSGSGKTSLLRSLAGLLTPDKGRISKGGKVWFDSKERVHMPPQKRNVGYVFQENALFPNMTVRGNLQFAQKKGAPPGLIEELIVDMDLHDLQDRYPDTLSGGQKQRASLARALAQQPDILLLDEPLAALDGVMRLKLQEYILSSHRKFKLTTLMVSHDLAEIIKLSDTTILLDKGRISKMGTPQQVFMGNKLSGKFQFTGTLLELEVQSVITVASVLIGNQIVKVAAHPTEVEGLSPGDKVVVASKAFNPVIYKIEEK